VPLILLVAAKKIRSTPVNSICTYLIFEVKTSLGAPHGQ
jgi:hypothetical protein